MSELPAPRSAPPPPSGPLFWTGVVLGWALIAVGVIGALIRVNHPDAWAVWLLGAAVVHDALVAPIVFGVGRVLRRGIPPWARAYVQGAVAFTALAALVALPFLLGFGRDPRNPSALPVNYWGGLLVLLIEGGLVWTLVWSVRSLVRSLRAGPGLS